MPLSFLFNWGTFPARHREPSGEAGGRNPQSLPAIASAQARRAGKILHLLQLITASLEAEGLTGSEDKSVELFKEKYEKNSRDF